MHAVPQASRGRWPSWRFLSRVHHRPFSRASQNAKVSSECQPRAAVGDESGAGTPKSLLWELAQAGGLDRFRHRPVVHEEARMVQELSSNERGGA